MKKVFQTWIPPRYYFGLLVAFYGAYLLVTALLWWFIRDMDPDQSSWESFTRMMSSEDYKDAPAGLAGFVAFWYGALRAYVPSPWLRTSYGRWLRTLPWEPGDPLPLGSLQWTIADAVALAPLMLIALPTEYVHPIHILALFAGSYLLIMIVQIAQPRTQWHLWLVAFLIVMMTVLVESPLMLLLVTILAYAVAHRAIQIALTEFHTNDKTVLQWFQQKLQVQTPLVYPYSILRHDLNDFPMGRINAILFSVLIGAIVAAMMHADLADGGRRPSLEDTWGYLTLLGALLGGVRLFRCVLRGLPPLSLRGRLALGRWIIPRYEVIFVAPAMLLLIGIALPRLLYDARLGQEVFVPITVTALLLAFFLLPPRLSQWMLTGDYRGWCIEPASRSEMRRN